MNTSFKNIKNILFPTDFSESAKLAVPLALEMAATFKARLTCLHVTEDPTEEWICSWSLEPETSDPMMSDGRSNRRSAALKQLRSFAEEHLADLPSPPNLEVVAGQPIDEIVRFAKERDVDLIIMGGRGYGDAETGLHETNPDRVIQMTSTPVLTVCEPAAEFIRL